MNIVVSVSCDLLCPLWLAWLWPWWPPAGGEQQRLLLRHLHHRSGRRWLDWPLDPHGEVSIGSRYRGQVISLGSDHVTRARSGHFGQVTSLGSGNWQFLVNTWEDAVRSGPPSHKSCHKQERFVTALPGTAAVANFPAVIMAGQWQECSDICRKY